MKLLSQQIITKKSALKTIKTTTNANLIDGKISIGRHSNERNLNKMKNKKNQI